MMFSYLICYNSSAVHLLHCKENGVTMSIQLHSDLIPGTMCTLPGLPHTTFHQWQGWWWGQRVRKGSRPVLQFIVNWLFAFCFSGKHSCSAVAAFIDGPACDWCWVFAGGWSSSLISMMSISWLCLVNFSGELSAQVFNVFPTTVRWVEKNQATKENAPIPFTGVVGAVSELMNTISSILSGKCLMPALSGTASE